MKNNYCLDCGNRLSKGRCSNCHEELIINDEQMGEYPMKVSNEWEEKVKNQRKIIKENNEKEKK